MKRPVVPKASFLLLTLSLAVFVLPAPSVAACDQRDCYNEIYVAAGGHALGADAGRAFVCVVEPCGNGGASVGGTFTESHSWFTYALGEIVDFNTGRHAPLGLCGEDLEGRCVADAEVRCGFNVIWDNQNPFANLRTFTPTYALTNEMGVCFATAGIVRAVFENETAAPV